MKRFNLKKLKWAGLFLLLLFLTNRVSLPFQGLLVDADTGKSVPNAEIFLAVREDRDGVSLGDQYGLQVSGTRANEKGRFFIGGGVTLLSLTPLFGWNNQISIAVPGYYPKQHILPDSLFLGVPHPLTWIIPIKISLVRLRYQSDLEYDKHFWKTGPYSLSYPENIRFKPIGSPGIFATKPNEQFSGIQSQLPQMGPSVHILSSDQGKVFTWNMMGDFEDEIYWDKLVSDGSHLTNSREMNIGYFRHWLSNFSLSDPPANVKRINELLQNDSQIECAARGRGIGYFDLGVLVSRESGKHSVYLFPDNSKTINTIRKSREVIRSAFGSPAPANPGFIIGRNNVIVPRITAETPVNLDKTVEDIKESVSACTLGSNMGTDILYVAFEKGGIRSFTIPTREKLNGDPLVENRKFWENNKSLSIDASDGAKTYVDIQFDGKATIFAVTGGDTIYRFLLDGRPDQKIDFE